LNFDSFPLGPFIISIGGIFVLFGFFTAAFLLIFNAFQKKLSLDFLSQNFWLFLIVPIFLGRASAFFKIFSSLCAQSESSGFFAKIFFLVKNFFSPFQNGFDNFWVFWGFILFFIFFALYKKQPLLKWFDAFALPTILFFVFYFIGGFFSAWGYGKPVGENFWLAVSYDLQNVRFSGPIHPAQIYSAIIFTTILFFGFKFWKKSFCEKIAWRDGTFFGLILFVGFFANGMLEFFRGDATTIVFQSVRFSQLLSFTIAVFALIFLSFQTHKN